MSRHYIVLSGGVGGSKLAEGLSQHLSPKELTIAVNTGDDFDHLGLRICPDIDTVLYMLSGLVSRERGWGREDETWVTHEMLKTLGGPSWFMLGDKDLALHLFRTQAMAAGQSLSDVISRISESINIRHIPVPLTEIAVPTRVITPQGVLDFQDYFVGRRAEVDVSGLLYGGTDDTPLSPGLEKGLANPALAGIIIAPSNPFLSIEPMLRTGGLRRRIIDADVPVICVSPYVAGQAIKGPVARVQRDLGFAEGDAGVIAHYGEMLDYFLTQSGAEPVLTTEGLSLIDAPTMMTTAAERSAVARHVLDVLQCAGK